VMRPWVQDLLAPFAVVLLVVQVLQLPVTAVGSVENSGEIPYPPFGRSDPALMGTEDAQRILQRPSVAGRERLSVYLAIRRKGLSSVLLEASSELDASVLSAVSDVKMVPLFAMPTGLLFRAKIVTCEEVLFGVDAQTRYRIVTHPVDGLFRERRSVVFRFQDEEWIVSARCLHGR
jgi:hypothetical protein